MNKFIYAIADMFEWGFKIMFSTGVIVNLLFIGLLSVFTVFWIREMVRNPDKVKTRH